MRSVEEKKDKESRLMWEYWDVGSWLPPTTRSIFNDPGMQPVACAVGSVSRMGTLSSLNFTAVVCILESQYPPNGIELMT